MKLIKAVCKVKKMDAETETDREIKRLVEEAKDAGGSQQEFRRIVSFLTPISGELTPEQKRTIKAVAGNFDYIGRQLQTSAKTILQKIS